MSKVIEKEDILLEPLPPSNPNCPAGTTILPLHPITLWPVGTINNVFVLPGPLDWDRFLGALKKITAIWPNVVGRFIKPSDRTFAIKVTRSALPVTRLVVEQDTILPTSNVVQPSLAPFLPKLPQNYCVPDADSPMLAMQLTTLLPSKRSVVGMQWGHVLGDGANCNEFVRQLSYLYAHPEESISPEQYPSFFAHIQLPRYPPSPQMMETWDKWCIQPVPFFGPEGMIERYGAAGKTYEMKTVALHRGEVRALKKRIREKLDEGEIISEQDCLSGWWVSLLERVEAGKSKRRPMEGVINSVNYRHLAGTHAYFPANLPTLTANVAQMITTPIPPLSSVDEFAHIVDIARAIRGTLNTIRSDPENTADWLAVCAYQLEESLSTGQAQCLVPPENECMVNSNLRYDWNHTFGFPWDQTAYYTSACLPRFLRVFQANPSAGEAKGETDVELIWSARRGEDANAWLEKVIAEDRARWMR